MKMKKLRWRDLSETLRLEDVLDELGLRVVEVRKGGEQLDFHCPLDSHPGSDVTPSFGINSEELIWNCFTCGEGGTLPSLVIKLRDIKGAKNRAWQESLEWLLPFTDHIESEERDTQMLKLIDEVLGNEDPPERSKRSLLPGFTAGALDKLELCPLELLSKWGIKSEQTIATFGLRYSEEWTHIGHKHTGPAIVIPHYFGGKLVGHQSRWLGIIPSKMPKYTNSSGFPKSDTIFNWDRAVLVDLVLVESPMTVIRLHELGISAVATFGAAVSDEQLRLLRNLNSVVLSYDNDPPFQNAKGDWVLGAGYKALSRVAEALDRDIHVEVVPSIDKEKGDLADLNDDEILSQLGLCAPYVPLFTNV